MAVAVDTKPVVEAVVVLLHQVVIPLRIIEISRVLLVALVILGP
jgi:hypothetical protein